MNKNEILGNRNETIGKLNIYLGPQMNCLGASSIFQLYHLRIPIDQFEKNKFCSRLHIDLKTNSLKQYQIIGTGIVNIFPRSARIKADDQIYRSGSALIAV